MPREQRAPRAARREVQEADVVDPALRPFQRPRERLPRRPAAALGPLGRPVHAGRRWAGRRARARFADSGFPRVRLRRYATS